MIRSLLFASLFASASFASGSALPGATVTAKAANSKRAGNVLKTRHDTVKNSISNARGPSKKNKAGAPRGTRKAIGFGQWITNTTE